VNNARLHCVNCHATTEAADLVGGLRPVRHRSSLAYSINVKSKEFIATYRELNADDKILARREADDEEKFGEDDDPSRLANQVSSLWEKWCSRQEKRTSKRMKVTVDPSIEAPANSSLRKLHDEISCLLQRYNSLFEWVDGPLVEAMKCGEYLLLDEISLADDAVLERLNRQRQLFSPRRVRRSIQKQGLFKHGVAFNSLRP
jgi:midasin